MADDATYVKLRASTDQYGAGLRDLAADNPALHEMARAMARMIREQHPAADGSTVIAAAQAASGAIAMVRAEGGELEAGGVVNLIMLAGMALNAADTPEVPGA